MASGTARAIYVSAGQATVNGAELAEDDGIVSTDKLSIRVGDEGATVWRWEVVPPSAPKMLFNGRGQLCLAAPIDGGQISDSIAEIDRKGATLGDGSRIDAATIVWTAGVRPSGLAAMVPGEHAPDGRLRVDSCMRVATLDGVFAAGDIAAAPTEDGNETVMSCQHGRPMGRTAGFNAACDLIGNDMISLRFNPYVTCIDLGPFGALLTAGYDRRLVETSKAIKERKTTTNRINIYPPKPANRASLMEAAAPVVEPKRSMP